MTRKYYRWFVAGVILSVMLLGVGTPGFVRAAVLPAPPAPVKIFLPFVEGGLSVGAPKPTATPTVQSTPTSIVQPTATPTLQPTATPIPRPTSTPRPQPSPTPSSGGVTVLAAGDIAMCGRPGDQQTAKIISGISGTVLALGDNAYDSGLSTEYSTCYDPTWGAFKNRTYPVPGNHDYMTLGATGYFGYFGAVAGNPSQGYYSFDLGTWHIIAINSNCSQVGGCKPTNPQGQWLAADLAAHPAQCTLAFWHHPFFSSGYTGGRAEMSSIYTQLYDAGVDVVLSGHDHDYERFAPQNPAGNLDTARGITEFVVGVGGSNFTTINYPLQPNSQTIQNTAFGVLKLSLNPGGYSWQFISVNGSYTDSGSGTCH